MSPSVRVLYVDDEPDFAERTARRCSTSTTGTGFGLRIVEQVVEAHGWEISVTEGEEGGARFEITGIEIVR